jgi:hypothetical protein
LRRVNYTLNARVIEPREGKVQTKIVLKQRIKIIRKTTHFKVPH